MAAQATLSTAAKRQAQQGQGSQQQSGVQRGGKAGEEDAAKPLKWTCAYSFKYR
jgi:hypothetical protein